MKGETDSEEGYGQKKGKDAKRLMGRTIQTGNPGQGTCTLARLGVGSGPGTSGSLHLTVDSNKNTMTPQKDARRPRCQEEFFICLIRGPERQAWGPSRNDNLQYPSKVRTRDFEVSILPGTFM